MKEVIYISEFSSLEAFLFLYICSLHILSTHSHFLHTADTLSGHKSSQRANPSPSKKLHKRCDMSPRPGTGAGREGFLTSSPSSSDTSPMVQPPGRGMSMQSAKRDGIQQGASDPGSADGASFSSEMTQPSLREASRSPEKSPVAAPLMSPQILYMMR